MAQPVAGVPTVSPALTYAFVVAFFAALLGAMLYLTSVSLTDEAHSWEADPRVDAGS